MRGSGPAWRLGLARRGSSGAPSRLARRLSLARGVAPVLRIVLAAVLGAKLLEQGAELGSDKVARGSLVDRLAQRRDLAGEVLSVRQRTLGTLAILRQLEWARRDGRAHLYLGYWIAGHAKMDYKRRFRPLEGFDGRGWRPLVAGPTG